MIMYPEELVLVLEPRNLEHVLAGPRTTLYLSIRPRRHSNYDLHRVFVTYCCRDRVREGDLVVERRKETSKWGKERFKAFWEMTPPWDIVSCGGSDASQTEEGHPSTTAVPRRFFFTPKWESG